MPNSQPSPPLAARYLPIACALFDARQSCSSPAELAGVIHAADRIADALASTDSRFNKQGFLRIAIGPPAAEQKNP